MKAITRLSAAFCIALAAPVYADGIVENVNGITLDKDGKVVRFSAALIDREGKVSQLLTSKEKAPKQLDFRHDGRGLTMLPGLIDAHGHVMGLGFAALTLDLSGTNSLEEAQAAIKAYAAKYPERRWIVGRGWNQEKWGLGRFPTSADLDAVVADRPIWLERVDGHAGWANSKAMEIAGVTGATKSPAGGRIEMAGAKPSGIFVDAASDLVAKHIPAPKPAERDLALAEAQKALLSVGVTSIADMGTTIEDWQSYRRAGDAGWLSIRIFGYAGGIDNMVAIAGPRPTPWLYDDKLRLGGVKLYLDGALGSRGAWLKKPYADAPGQTGLSFLASAEIRNLMVRASMDGFQTAVHAIGDAANADAIGAVEDLAETYAGDRRWRIEHVQIVDPADLPRLAKNGIIASMQPVHQTSDRLMAEARLGPERLAGAYAWNSILKAGGKLAFGSDTPVEAPNPFAGIAAAMTREDAQGQPFGGWIPAERVTREQALAGFTIGAAYAAFAEGKVGSLTPGHRADFILVDTDPLLASPAQIRAARVKETWLGGRPVYKQDDIAKTNTPNDATSR
ncbi:MAG TPA: amidohydrolase family protein [Sphingorhabdus sp.]|jgi:predicted amidohydrolase YtcJ|uniref:amidohydrolase n=1 Tax=Sphingorhabdus sp. TaxID=1902408 RepID=UPI002B55353B|nr:amidohydrolase family protein [Sphingorhabdus sp.]HMT42414.1 amidohydrolase family protein [Sphingorhabdus sp.]HMU22337.1 amidohydrolase family protein [Sphingorhabdus sp.]